MEISYSNYGGAGPQGPVGAQGVQGITGLSGISTIASASYYSTQTQGPFTANSIQPVTVNNTDWQNKVTLVDGSKITFTEGGKFDIQFSAQLEQTSSSGTVSIWLSKGGVNVPNSNTRIHVAASNPYAVAAWNFFVTANAGEYYQIMWSSTSSNTILESQVYDSLPRIPSVIITVNQIG